ncbi:12-oxophytodienoate reductase [Kribbella sp. ALI-6-A]|uniref:NADH:flavin oxidoreductase n=1 Tax=Kribbella sp. ALI-6-A TaxID=1933817 RepID=UPI00097C3976|nr:NADH:flavin oxidoreductase [Kribbella sp. ALI-6-A]ONI74111.1 12-oxophytodienoate reductase [Kribbella sp. ALI-6-A]
MSSPDTSALFRPFAIKGLEVKNRVVMSPMTRAMAPGGIPREANAAYYQRRAEAQVGLILSEGTVIERPASRNHPDVPSFFGREALAGWKTVIEAVHGAGGRMGPQLWHTGSTRHPDWEPEAPVESPSGLLAPGIRRGEAMSPQAIDDTIAAYARAAADAQQLGFDLVEIHGAHGYLIDEFFWAGTNLRTDRYGGASIKQRSRFAVEIITAVRAAVGPDFPISLRVSQWKAQDYTVKLAHTPAEMSEWLGPLVAAGVDILHCSQRRYWEPEFPEVDGDNGLNFAGWAKKLTGAATISVGSVGLANDSANRSEKSATVGLDRLVERMERDEFDLIAVGRALLTDPRWILKTQGHDDGPLQGFDPAALSVLT